jgi:hypothetical protein
MGDSSPFRPRRRAEWRGNAKLVCRARQCRAPTTAKGPLPAGAEATLVKPRSSRFISYPFISLRGAEFRLAHRGEDFKWLLV